ncbi:MAG TPA: hypothetical protein VIK86_03545 [Candidatus Paceibacterota bacterium]
MQIKLTNKIADRIEEYQANTGTTKIWICKQLGITKQRLHSICKADNIMLDLAFKIAYFLKTDIESLFECEVIDNR